MRTDVILLPGLHGSAALFDAFIALAPAWARCRVVSLPVDGAQSFDETQRCVNLIELAKTMESLLDLLSEVPSIVKDEVQQYFSYLAESAGY
jgi:hypothetical protein